MVKLVITMDFESIVPSSSLGKTFALARLAQLVERNALNVVVEGSSPSVGVYPSWVTFIFAPLAQLAERSTVNRKVAGSNPARSDLPQWRNWIAHLTSNQEVGGSSPPWGA